MLAHELRRPMAAVRVAGEAVALLRDQGRDITPMLDLLLGEVGDLDAPATDVLGDLRDRGTISDEEFRHAKAKLLGRQPEAASPDGHPVPLTT